MTDIGSRLQKGRLQRAMTLRQISDATKISLSVLEALERNEFSRLPGGIFARGYVRAYAGQVGLDPEELVEELRLEEPPSEEEQQLIKMHTLLDDESRVERLKRASILLVSLLLAIYVGLVSRSTEPRSTSDAALDRTVLAEAQASAETQAPRIVHDFPKNGTQVALEYQDLRLELLPRGPCWISATADGRPVVYQLMQPGDRVTVDARNEINLRIGDAGLFAFLINGVPGRRLGRPGEVVSVRITKGNYHTWQATDEREEDLDGGGRESEAPL